MEHIIDEDQLSLDDHDIVNISHPRLKNILESLLFVTKKPITVDEIRKVIRVEKGLIERTLHELIAEYSNKGIIISKIAGGFQLITNSENIKYVDKLLQSPIETTLSNAALETLSIIAYKQPVTRIAVDNIRGVSSDGVIQTLLERKLIAEIGRGSGVGRPRLYGTTIEFLRHFGLKELTDLPPFPHDESGQEIYKNILHEETSSDFKGSQAEIPTEDPFVAEKKKMETQPSQQTNIDPSQQQTENSQEIQQNQQYER